MAVTEAQLERVDPAVIAWLEEMEAGLRQAAATDRYVGDLKWSPYIPHLPKPKQRRFLGLDCREAFYGGAAYGGKSEALLMGALQYVDEPGYAAILFRRSYTDLALPGALMDRAQEWLIGSDAQWSAIDKRWTFPSGASLTFGYLDGPRDHFRYQSAEFQFVGFDELTQFEEAQYLYLFSRIRRLAGASVPLRMRSASNPGGIGHEWVKARFVEQPEGATDCVFVPAKLADLEGVGDTEEYRVSLAKLDPITRAQLEDGDWEVRLEDGMFERAWFPVMEVFPPDLREVRFWDFAATKLLQKDPKRAATAGVRAGMNGDGKLRVKHSIREHIGAGESDDLVVATAQHDGRQVAVRWEEEPGSAGKKVSANLMGRLTGWDARGIPAAGQGDKITRAKPVAALGYAGMIELLRGPWNADYIDEHCLFPLAAYAKDQVDATSGALAYLTEARGDWIY